MNWWKVVKLRGDVNVHLRGGKGAAGSFTPGYHRNPDKRRTIDLYLQTIKRMTQKILGRPATDKEVDDHFQAVLRHESGHAAHEHIEQPTEKDNKGWANMFANTKNVFQKEFVAYTTEYAGKPYYIMEGLLEHGYVHAYAKMVFGPIKKWLDTAIPDTYTDRRFADNRGAFGPDLVRQMRNKLLDLHWKYGKVENNDGRFVDIKAINVPKDKKQAINMYGEENKDFIMSLKIPSGGAGRGGW